MTSMKSATLLDWSRTLLVIVTTCGAVFLAYGRIEAKADKGANDAAEAKEKAVEVEKIARETKDEFLKMASALASDVRNVRTILDERLPRAEPVVAAPR